MEMLKHLLAVVVLFVVMVCRAELSMSVHRAVLGSGSLVYCHCQRTFWHKTTRGSHAVTQNKTRITRCDTEQNTDHTLWHKQNTDHTLWHRTKHGSHAVTQNKTRITRCDTEQNTDHTLWHRTKHGSHVVSWRWVVCGILSLPMCSLTQNNRTWKCCVRKRDNQFVMYCHCQCECTVWHWTVCHCQSGVFCHCQYTVWLNNRMTTYCATLRFSVHSLPLDNRTPNNRMTTCLTCQGCSLIIGGSCHK